MTLELTRAERAARDLRHHEIIADEYERVVNEPRTLGNNALFRKVFGLVPKQRRQMLDIGCGTGQMTLRFGRKFAAVTAVDHSAAMLQIAQANLAVEPALGSRVTCLEQDAFSFASAATTQFDFICAVGFLHHLSQSDLTEMLRLLKQRLAVGGRMVFAEPLAFDPADEPKLAQWWNAPFRAQFAGYFKEAEDPDEGPIPLQLMHQTLAKVGLRLVYERRGWELFPRFGGNVIDRLAIPILDLFTRKLGVVGMFVVEAA